MAQIITGGDILQKVSRLARRDLRLITAVNTKNVLSQNLASLIHLPKVAEKVRNHLQRAAENLAQTINATTRRSAPVQKRLAAKNKRTSSKR